MTELWTERQSIAESAPSNFNIVDEVTGESEGEAMAASFNEAYFCKLWGTHRQSASDCTVSYLSVCVGLFIVLLIIPYPVINVLQHRRTIYDLSLVNTTPLFSCPTVFFVSHLLCPLHYISFSFCLSSLMSWFPRLPPHPCRFYFLFFFSDHKSLLYTSFFSTHLLSPISFPNQKNMLLYYIESLSII